MENTINYGIDLGTTNSAIAKFVKGEVIIFQIHKTMVEILYLLLFPIKKIK
jgi:molecular chaperone DnaK (HSP70)